MSDELCERLRELMSKATPGPWALDFTEVHGRLYGVRGITVSAEDSEGNPWLRLITGSGGAQSWTDKVCEPAGADDDEATLRLIVEAVNALPELLDTITRLKARVEELEGALRPFASFAVRIPDESPDALCIFPSWSRDDKPIATALDFRRARNTLTPPAEGGRD